MKGLQGNGKGRGSPRGPGGGPLTAGPGPRALPCPRVPARRFRRPRARPAQPVPHPPVTSAGAAILERRRRRRRFFLSRFLLYRLRLAPAASRPRPHTKKIEPLVRPTDAGSTRSPSARLLMTAPGPAADGPLPSARS